MRAALLSLAAGSRAVGRSYGLALLVLGTNLALALLLVALLAVHAVSSYAKVILVAEERRSALLAFVSSAGFCLRRSGAVVAQYLVVATLGVALFWLFGAASASLTVVGFRTQLVALALAEVLVALRIALRLGLLASQMELHRARRA